MKRVDNKEFLWYSLYSFAGFGLEILLLMIENIFIKEQTTFTTCFHWGLTAILWETISFILYKNSKSKLNFDLVNNNCVGKRNIFFSLVMIIIFLIAKCCFFNSIKSIDEFNNLGIIKFIFQYIYYLFETILILFTISFGQRFFEGISKNKIIPYGGLVLAFTWGLMHILTQNMATGIFAFASAILYGIVYLLLNKNTKYSFIGILLMFSL